MPTVSAHVAIALARHIDHVFGVMGNGNAYFLDALETQTPASFTAVRHEAGAVVAADAHHRAGGGLAAATTTYGAGFTNTLTALAEAVQAHVPLVLVVGDEPTSGPRPWGVDQIALASAVGARTYTVGRMDAAATTVIAIEHALAYRVPTVLAIPYDVAAVEVGPVPETLEPRLPAPMAPDSHFNAGAIADLAAALAGARRPLLLAGRGAWLADAGAQLGALAEATGALTATTALGRGIFPDARYDLGVTGGFGAPGAMELIREADVAVVFGASLNQFTMRFGELFAPGTRVVQVDVAPGRDPPARRRIHPRRRRRRGRAAGRGARARGSEPSGWRESVDLEARRAQDAGDGRPRGAGRRRASRPPRRGPADRRAAAGGSGHRLRRRPLRRLVEHVLAGRLAGPDDDGRHGLPVDRPRIPERRGRRPGKPDSTIVLTTGDGGALMALADLETAVRVAGGRGLAVVWNDAAYGAEVMLYGAKGLADSPMRIPEVDFAALASAVGAEGVVVRTLADLDALRAWTEQAVGERRFLLLDLRISGDVIAPYFAEVVANSH